MTHEVHLVTTETPPTDLETAMIRCGMSPVDVVATHDRLPSRRLYSAYLDDADSARKVFASVTDAAAAFDDVGILVERERVSREMKFGVPSDITWTTALMENLKALGDLPSEARRGKRADIHLSLPEEVLAASFATHVLDAGLTYIDVARNGSEDMLGIRPRNGETWRAFTVQYDGPGASAAANRAFSLFAELSEPDACAFGTLKVEIAASVWLNELHPGIPAIHAAA